MSTRRGGTVVQTGLHVGPAEVRPMVWSENDLTIAGTWCYHVYDWPRIAAMIERGTFPGAPAQLFGDVGRRGATH
jgi:(R,R)-butanediol dehydrogenase / meso-butanediol dehydrogenase / diacetyl reductase